MSTVYDNWVRLVEATLRREQLRRKALRSFSDLSLASSSSFNSRASFRPLSFNYLKIFTFAELKSATRNFRPDTVFDEGGFVRVFTGWVDEKTYAPSTAGVGIAVTVKLFYPESEQDLKAWQTEIEFLGKISHPNIVKLLGYCSEDNKFLLVFEYMHKGSLENHLFGTSELGKTISWEIRMKIAIGAARALAFLHRTEGQVIHRGIKTANIWLDGDYNTKLLNFSLTEFGNAAKKVVDELEVRNYYDDYSYAAPEYIAKGKLCLNSDVYIFGMMLLEIVSGRRVIDSNRPMAERNFVDWAKYLLLGKRRNKNIMRIIDPRLDESYPSRAVFQIADLILKCLDRYPENRPIMEQVLETLEKIK